MTAVLGLVELTAVAGPLLPAVTDIMPRLTPLAVPGLVPMMAGALLLHLDRGEVPSAALDVVVLAIATAVAYGRMKLVPPPERDR